jgi:hypothetical protein
MNKVKTTILSSIIYTEYNYLNLFDFTVIFTDSIELLSPVASYDFVSRYGVIINIGY